MTVSKNHNSNKMSTETTIVQYNDPAYSELVNHITNLWTEAKADAITSVNAHLLDANWKTGQYIVEFEQKGLSHKLTWSHYFELLKCDDPLEMKFYFTESIRQGWKVRELKRQIKSALFQRLALSTDKKGVLALANEGHQVLTPQDILRDPFVLEFAGLPQKKQYKEGELEAALKANMEKFLLELGRGFAFVGRQFVMHIGSRRLKVDLVFYHCILKCYVLIDLKRGEIKHGDIGQMNLYLNYFKTEICQNDDNPPIGIVLGAKKDELLLEYALEGITNQLFAARYQLYLPKREELQAQLDKILDEYPE